MTSKFQDLITKLKEIFQLDKPELDFGIYRIMHMRAKEISEFLNKQLEQKVKEALTEKSEAEKRDLEDALAKAIEGAKSAGFSPDESPKVKELRIQLGNLMRNAEEAESVVYAHLLAFFSRYYDDGDFISKRRYKDGVYAIPYAGEEVKLHWANADQYYTKSGENFTNYSFTLDGGAKVHFKLITAETAKDNIKDNDATRCFVLWDPAQKGNVEDESREDLPDTFLEEKVYEEEKNGKKEEKRELYIYFQFLKFPKKGNKQETFTAQAREKIFDALGHDLALLQRYNLTAKAPTEKDKNRTVFDKHFTTYTAKNTSDYFIHKDLKGFLTRELDFYIKNEMLHLDDVQRADSFKDIERNLRQIQTVRLIATELIAFMAQVEDFQKKLWLKKKFVTQCDYCITMDRVPKELHAEVLANEEQQAEWKRLAIEQDPKASDLTAIDARMVDTKFFNETFKAKLLQAIPDLDEQCDGLLIHSENFQALNLLQDRYKEQVKCIYIDPPYNTGNDGFLYKDGYSHSSWLTMLEERMRVSNVCLSSNALVFTSIDDNEQANIHKLYDSIFGKENFKSTSVVMNNRGGRDYGGIALQHDYCVVYTKSNIAKIQLLEDKDKVFRYYDSQGGFDLMELRNRNVKFNDKNRPNLCYPFYLNPLKKDDNNLFEISLEPHEGFIEVWPAKSNGIQTVWRWGKEEKARANLNVLIFGKENQNGGYMIVQKYRETTRMQRSIWDEKEFVNERGTEVIKEMFDYPNFAYPKSMFTIKRILELGTVKKELEIVLDYFGGSGTTAHATIALNREDGGKRKYILVEMGDHFETVLKPRVQKVVYSPEWKDGKPVSSAKGVSHCFKYMTLESYEDTLNNIELTRSANGDMLSSMMQQEYLFKYMLELESRGSIINTNDFRKPFDYQLKIAVDSSGASAPQKIDLVETFNYLIGLRVIQQNRQLEKGYLYEEGTLPNGDLALILWRDCDKVGDEDLNKLLEKLGVHPGNTEYQVIYVNGDHAVPNVTLGEADNGKRLKVLQIENVFLEKMFEETK